MKGEINYLINKWFWIGELIWGIFCIIIKSNGYLLLIPAVIFYLIAFIIVNAPNR